MKWIITILLMILGLCSESLAQDKPAPGCPTISVIGPASLTVSGNVMTFTVNVENFSDFKRAYKWTVSAGTIERGQGSASIDVRSPNEYGNVTATVELDGLPPGCYKTASETAGVAPGCILPVALDEFGKLPLNDEKARLSNVAVQLTQSPDMVALFIFHLTKRDTYASIDARVKRMSNFLNSIKVSSERFRFEYSDDAPSYSIRIYLLPGSAVDTFSDVENDLKKLRPHTRN